ncbi:5'-methylthioadenosine/S-adenosylhomocysteine nucleosidase family protein [Nocardiopsis salina]|uniref:5'-methylthioadenosine/S-adenosylhomocysteine nucleosidase family protein n=1 Tax=Nocardiopsis salina TaxID=245836 RepID=UPI00034B55BE|nr:hypothetical protein [Nocardiopsis salina]
MSHHPTSSNSGIVNLGGTNSFTNTAFGDHARVGAQSEPSPSGTSTPDVAAGSARRDVGIVTILPGEMRAVVDRLGLRRSHKVDDLFFSTGEIATESGRVSVVATQALSPGQRSVMGALENLRRHFSPRLWLLVGIGGGLHPEHARIGNVVVSTRVVYYDSRKITEGDQVQPRGEERQAPARVAHAVNAYFTDHGEPAAIRGQAKGHGKRTFEVVPGLLGSGEAVIAAKDSAVRGYLTHYNDKVLAVDMEAGGLSQYWQENSVGEGTNPGWVVIRGISDNADQDKNDDSHDLAARNAAHVARELLPYLC